MRSTAASASAFILMPTRSTSTTRSSAARGRRGKRVCRLARFSTPGRSRKSPSISALEIALHPRQKIDGARRVAADPPIEDLFDRQRIEVVPAQAPFTFHDDQVRALEDIEMLHDRAAIEARKSFAEVARGERL